MHGNHHLRAHFLRCHGGDRLSQKSIHQHAAIDTRPEETGPDKRTKRAAPGAISPSVK